MSRLPLLLAVVLGLALAWIASRPPASRTADAPATVFSAERAMADVRVIARAPHPVGSAENAAVRDHLLQRLMQLGLSTEVRVATVEGQRVENVYGLLAGTDRAAPTVLLMAHYDSVENSPGAADDAAGVAAILEALRAFRAAGTVPARDVEVLLTDGEEAGLLGAKAHFAASPDRAGIVLNFEARGAAGRAYMFETGAQNGALIDVFGRAVRSPSASSLARFVYDRMPNGTDFTEAKTLGVAGLNFAFIGDLAAYHTPLSTPERLDRGSLQHLGDQALAMLTALARAPALPARTEDAVFSDILGLTLVAYPAIAGWGVIGASALLLAIACWRAGATPRFGLSIAAGVARLLLGMVMAGLLLVFARLALSDAEEGLYRSELIGAPVLMMTGVGVVLALAILAGWSGRPSPGSATGALGLALAGAAAAQAAAPETAFVLAWPVLLGAALMAVLPGTRLGGWLAVAPAAVGFAWIAGLLHQLYLSLGLLYPEALAAGALLLPLVLAPLLTTPQAATRRGAALT